MTCSTVPLLTSTLDSSFGAALLLSTTGHVLHKNLHASILLLTDHEPIINQDHTVDNWIRPPPSSSHETWQEELSTLEGNDNHGRETIQSTLVKNDTVVLINLSLLPPCPCCQRAYVTAHVKSENSKLSVEEVSALQLDKDLVDASFDPMLVIDEEGVILMVNEATIQQFQYSHNELLHQNIALICGGPHGKQHEKYMKRYLATGQSKVMGKVRTLPARRKDGSEFPMELGIKEVSSCDGIHKRLFVGYIKDVTVHQQHEKEMVHQKILLQSMINASFDPMFQVNQKGIICLVNDAAVQLFGYTREEFLGNNIKMICGHEHAAQHDSYMQRYLETKEKRIIGRKRVVSGQRKDGSEFDIELGLQEVVVDNGETFFCGYIRDITQQRMDKRALQRKNRELQGQFFGRGKSSSDIM